MDEEVKPASESEAAPIGPTARRFSGAGRRLLKEKSFQQIFMTPILSAIMGPINKTEGGHQ
jgi:hypothetical protein